MLSGAGDRDPGAEESDREGGQKNCNEGLSSHRHAHLPTCHPMGRPNGQKWAIGQ